MKKLTFALLSLLLCFSLTAGAFAITITVDGAEVEQVNVKGEPVPDTGERYAQLSSLVPLRAVLNAMGLPVFYDKETGTVSAIRHSDPSAYIMEGSKTIDGTTFVIAWRLAEAADYKLESAPISLSFTDMRYEPENGYYRIIDYTTEMYLTAGQEMASQIYLSEATGSDDQLWLIRQLDGKNYTIINKSTGLALDMNSWSVEDGGNLIQYTYAGGTNQQWNFVPRTVMDTSHSLFFTIRNVNSQLDLSSVYYMDRYSDLDKYDVVQTSEPYHAPSLSRWGLEFAEPYVNPVDLVLETEAFAELNAYVKERFINYFFTDAYFSRKAKANAEAYLLQNHFAEADNETQAELIKGAMGVPFIDLMNGNMSEKLTANYEIVSVEEKPEPRYDEDYNEIGEVTYYVYTIAMECGGPDDIHTFTVETVDPEDEEHVRRVCEAIACFEPPIRKALKHFYYTGENYGTWNAWDGEVWNNTGSKDDVDSMVNMFAHELGHVIDSYFTVGDDVWSRALNLDIVPVSGYGQDNRWEDFGEFSQLYLLSRGNDELITAIELIYPNRTKAYRAALYNLDNEYYAMYKASYDEVTAPIGDTGKFDEEKYFMIQDMSGGWLTNRDGRLTLESNSVPDSRWQVSVLDDQRVIFYSSADGRALYVPDTAIGTVAVASYDGATPFATTATYENYQDGIIVSGGTKMIVSETGLCLGFLYGDFMAVRYEDARTWFQISPSGNVEGIGDFTIKSGDKYLVPSSADIGAQLVISDSSGNSLWHVYKLPNGIGYITNASSGLAIDISGESLEEGAAALAYTLSRNPNQTWLIIENENGTVSFRAQHSGLYLAVDEEGKAIQSETPYEWTLVSPIIIETVCR